VGDRVDADEPRPIPPDPAYTARALAHHRAVLSRAARPIAPAATVAVLPRTDGPTWAAALVAGALAVAVAAGLGLMAGRRTVRVRSG
jgi:hypothetical protein